jgi:hypothetical protein
MMDFQTGVKQPLLKVAVESNHREEKHGVR